MRLILLLIGSVALLGVLVAPTVPLYASSSDLRIAFEKGNSLYEAGDFEGAIGQYVELLQQDVEDHDLFFNLANAYYKNDELGKAVLYYERALRLRPRERDSRENLALVKNFLRDKQFVREQNRLVKGVVWLDSNLSTSEMFVFASLSYALLCLLAVAFVFRRTRFVSRIYQPLSVVSPGRLMGLTRAQDLLLAIAVFLVLFVSSGASFYGKFEKEKGRSEAIVLAEEIPVYSAPTQDSTLQFKIHEGTTVDIRESRGNWVRIQLPGDLSGWVPASSIERV